MTKAESIWAASGGEGFSGHGLTRIAFKSCVLNSTAERVSGSLQEEEHVPRDPQGVRRES